MLVIGAGWIGLEVAAAARMAGVEVTVLEAADLPLLRVLGPEVAQVFAGLHREHGVDLRSASRSPRSPAPAGTRRGPARRRQPRSRRGRGHRRGRRHATHRAGRSGGLAVRQRHPVTDAQLRTSDPDIFAAGDVASAFHPLLGTHIRVEHWANALHQPQTAAAAMLGQDAAYDRLPYFFTDQYDLGMEYSGYVPARRLRPGGLPRRRRQARVHRVLAVRRPGLAGMNVNIWDVNDAIQALIRSGQPADPARLADPELPLAGLLPG